MSCAGVMDDEIRSIYIFSSWFFTEVKDNYIVCDATYMFPIKCMYISQYIANLIY